MTVNPEQYPMIQSPGNDVFITLATELKKALLGRDITAIRIYDDAGGEYVEYIRKEQP